MTQTELRSLSAEIDGRDYEVVYRERRGSGPTIVLIHGIPTSSLLWRHVQDELGDDAHSIAIDMLGYGRSEKPADADLGIAFQSRLLSAVIDRLGLPPALLVGHDIGGGVAQLTALDDPEAVTGLVLVDAIAYDSFPEPTIARMKDPQWDERIHTVDLPAGFRRSLEKGMVGDAETLDAVARQYAEPFIGPDGLTAYLRAARAVRTEELANRAAEVERLSIPIEIIWGEEDLFQPAAYGARLAAAIPGSGFEIVPEGRHFLPENHAPEIVVAIRRALDRAVG